jgi:hypothetical protein
MTHSKLSITSEEKKSWIYRHNNNSQLQKLYIITRSDADPVASRSEAQALTARTLDRGSNPA